MDLKVSIIIPVYNVEKYVEKCLDSVINQTLRDIEVLCINDGSTDGSKKILEEYAKKDGRIKIINQKNAGLGAARNTGLKYAKGEYIGFVDSDDWVDLNMFEEMYNNAKFQNSDIVICPINLFNENTGELVPDPYYDLECFGNDFDNCGFDFNQTKNFIFDITVNAYNKIYRTNFLKRIKAKFPEGLLFEDVPFFYKTYVTAKTVSLVKCPLMFHRINRASSITTKVDRKHFDIIKIQNMMVEIFLSLPNFNDYKIELLNRKILRIIKRYFEMDDKYKHEFFDLIKNDFKKMNLQKEDLNDLNWGIKNYYQNVMNSSSYIEFEEKQEMKLQQNVHNNESKKYNINKIDNIKSFFNNLKNNIKNKNVFYSYILFNGSNNGIKNTFINIKGYRSIKKNNLFDVNYYLEQNNDVKLSHMCPIIHYMYYGHQEGRRPNPSFEGDYYLNTYKDVKDSNLNPLVHYSLYGIKEGRNSIQRQKSNGSKTQTKMEGKNFPNKLIISFCFTPYMDTSANVVAKRIRELNKAVDVIQNDMSGIRGIDKNSNLITEDLIGQKIIIDEEPFFGSWGPIKNFCRKGMEQIDENIQVKGEYSEIYSRAMFPASHFLAFEYKLQHPTVKWTAEFSDPLIYDTEGKIRYSKIDDQGFLSKINRLLLKKGFSKYNGDNLFFLCEYLPYLFADEIIFTNENQMEYMINKFPIPEISNIIEEKAQIMRHPTLKKKYYNIIESNYFIDMDFVNLAYFGRDYETRNLNDVFYALHGLEGEYQNKCKIHFFTSDVDGFNESMECNPIKDNLIVNHYVDFLEFLNLTTKFDCLIVNDAYKTSEINPYLPSKLSDYLGSGTDIWIIGEEGSAMSKYDVKYKSFLGDTQSARQTLKEIIQDYSFRMEE